MNMIVLASPLEWHYEDTLVNIVFILVIRLAIIRRSDDVYGYQPIKLTRTRTVLPGIDWQVLYSR